MAPKQAVLPDANWGLSMVSFSKLPVAQLPQIGGSSWCRTGPNGTEWGQMGPNGAERYQSSPDNSFLRPFKKNEE